MPLQNGTMEESSLQQRRHWPDEILLHIVKLATKRVGERFILDWMYQPTPPDPLETGRVPFNSICCNLQGREIRRLIDPQTRLRLALASKTLYRIMLPILYHTVVLTTYSQVEAFASLVQSKPDLASLVKVFGADDSSWAIGPADPLAPLVRKIYFGCPNLIAFDDICQHGVTYHLPLPLAPPGMTEWSPRLQYLYATDILSISPYTYLPLRPGPPLFFTNLSTYSDLRFLSLAFEAERPDIDTPKLSLPHLELLSLTFTGTYCRIVDGYLAHAQLPKLHTLQVCVSQHLYSGPIGNPFEHVQELLRCHGNKLLTVKITDLAEEECLNSEPSEYLPNLKQLVVNEKCRLTVLDDVANCPSLQILEITAMALDNQVAGGGLTRLLIDNPPWRLGFKNIRTIRLSSMPHQTITEKSYKSLLESFGAFIQKNKELFAAQGVELVSKVEVGPLGLASNTEP